jgi:hypothetical protein
MTTMAEPMRSGATMAVETGQDGDPTHISTSHSIDKTGDDSEPNDPEKKQQRKCCGCFLGNQVAIGYNIMGLGEF